MTLLLQSLLFSSGASWESKSVKGLLLIFALVFIHPIPIPSLVFDVFMFPLLSIGI